MGLMGSLESWKPHKQAHLVSAVGQTGYKHGSIRRRNPQFAPSKGS